MAISITRKLLYFRWLGPTLTLNPSNAPWLSNVLKITGLTVPNGQGANSRSTYTGTFNGATPGGTLSALVQNVEYELNSGLFNGWSLPTAIEVFNLLTPGVLTQLATPTGTQATANSATALNVAASSVPNASSYRLYTSATQTGAYAQLGGVLTTPTYNHAGLSPAQTQWYKWQAVGDGTTYSDSAQSAAFSGTTQTATNKLAKPVIATPISVTATTATFALTAAVPNANSYFFRLNSGTIYPLGNVTTYTATGLNPSSTVTGEFYATDTTGTYTASDYSNLVSATTASNAAPTITSLSPTSGLQGSQVVITGTNFTGATQVSINSATVQSFVVNSATQITATLTGSQATGLVRVTTSAGTAVSTTSFTVTNPPFVQTDLLGLTIATDPVYTHVRTASLFPAGQASDYSYDFMTLPPIGVASVAIPSNAIRLSAQPGIFSDADIVEGSTNYGTDCTSAIQQFLLNGAATATASNPFLVNWDIRTAISAELTLGSYCYVYAERTYGAIVRPNPTGQTNIWRNQNYNFSAITDTNLGVYGGIWNHNAFSGNVAPGSDSGYNQRHSGANGGWNCPFQFRGVNNLVLDGIYIIRQRTFAIHLFDTTNSVLRNGVINSGSNGAVVNTDGIHYNGDHHNLTIDNWYIKCADDHIAISVNDAVDRDVRQDQGPSTYYAGYYNANSVIDGFTINNIEAYGSSCIRILSGANPVRNGTVTNLYGEIKNYWLVVDNIQDSPNFDGGGPGDVENVTFENVYINCKEYLPGTHYNVCANICVGLAKDFTFKNVKRGLFDSDTMQTLYINGVNTVVQNLVWDGYRATDFAANTHTTDHISIVEGTVNGLHIKNAIVERLSAATGNNLISLNYGAKATGITIERTQTSGLEHIVNQVDGELGIVLATDVIHLNAGANMGSFNSTVTPGPQVTPVNVTTQQLLQGTFTSTTTTPITLRPTAATLSYNTQNLSYAANKMFSTLAVQRVATNATTLQVALFSTVYQRVGGSSGLPVTTAAVSVYVNDVYQESITPTANATEQIFPLTLPSGTKEVSFLFSAQSRGGDTGDIEGTIVRSITAGLGDSLTSIIPSKNAVAVATITDSIGDGIGTTYPAYNGYVALLRQRHLNAWDITAMDSYGGKFAGAAFGSTSAVNTHVAALKPVFAGTTSQRVLVALGTNDAITNAFTAAQVASYIGSFADAVRAAYPSAIVVVANLTPLGTKDNSTYNTAIEGVLTQARTSYVRIANVRAQVTTADLIDNVHPGNAANVRMTNVIEVALA